MSRPRVKAFTLVQLVLTVFVLALMIKFAFHARDARMPRHAQSPIMPELYQEPGVIKPDRFKATRQWVAEPTPQEASSVAVVPFTSLDGDDERGPLLARVLRRYRPLTTDQQVDGLVDTLPPNASPSVIVILPSVEKPPAPEVEKSSHRADVEDTCDAAAPTDNG